MVLLKKVCVILNRWLIYNHGTFSDFLDTDVFTCVDRYCMLHVSRERLWGMELLTFMFNQKKMFQPPLLKTNGLAGQRHLFNRKEVAC